MTKLTPVNTLRTFALVCVAVTSLFIMFISTWLIYLLQSDWCGRAIGAVEDVKSARPEYAVGGCFSLLNAQVDALAWNSYLSNGVIALCLFVLVVIVIAGGRASLKLSREGVEADVSREAAEGAQAATDAAQTVADELKQATGEADPTPGG